jgi:VanZ family protein
MKMPIDPRLDVGGGRFSTPDSPLLATLILQRRLWVALWCLLAAITTVLYLLPNAGPPGQANIDKICHLIAFGSVGFSALLGAGRLRAAAPLLVSFVLAMSLEWLQSYVPGREYSLLDWAANLVGLALGIGVAAVVRAGAARAAGDLS